jgi:hypothetical protein
VEKLLKERGILPWKSCSTLVIPSSSSNPEADTFKIQTHRKYLVNMKLNFFLIIPFTAVLGGVFERSGKPGCDSDNCARAVTGTRLGPVTAASHVADCVSFQQVTTYYGL